MEMEDGGAAAAAAGGKEIDANFVVSVYFYNVNIQGSISLEAETDSVTNTKHRIGF